jgi:hypothetical protein
VVLFYYLLKDVDLAQVWAEIQAMTWTEDAALAAIAAWNLATYGLLWMSVTPGLGFGRAMVMTQAASAVTNTVPTVGPAIGVGMTYSMLRSWGLFGVADLGSGAGLGGVEHLRQAGPAGAGPGPARPPGQRLGGAGHPGPCRHCRAGGRHRDLRPAAAQRAAGRAVRPAGRAGRLPAAGAPPPPASAGLGAGHGQVPHPDPGAAGARLGTDHRRHSGQPPVAVPGPAGLPARGRGQRRRGLLGPGAGGVCVHAAGDHRPPYPRQRGGGGVGAARAAGGRRWRPGAGDRRGAGVPGPDLGAADPSRGRLLSVVAAKPAADPARHHR